MEIGAWFIKWDMYIYILIDDIWMIINMIYDIISNMILSRSKLIDDFPSYKPPFIVDLPLPFI